MLNRGFPPSYGSMMRLIKETSGRNFVYREPGKRKKLDNVESFGIIRSLPLQTLRLLDCVLAYPLTG